MKTAAWTVLKNQGEKPLQERIIVGHFYCKICLIDLCYIWRMFSCVGSWQTIDVKQGGVSTYLI
ncbi:hypothetical protein IHE45_04G155900 [Dioscorea alata]|uniref:Uncharacterized protein n=1 Tax=Dioscorea alata TaxID=55571 RepID=A0ACB7WH65_DIOAL|nr:hypothetical protein IHE45_04G155900 [Dioscorea alata]